MSQNESSQFGNGQIQSSDLSQNGPKPNPPKTVLPMFDASQQRHSRGSIGASRTQINSTGQYVAMVFLFTLIMKVLTERKADDVPDAEEVDPANLTAEIIRSVLAINDFEEPSGEQSELRARAEILRALRLKRPVRQVRELISLANEKVAERLASVYRRLIQAVEFAPAFARPSIELFTAKLDSIQFDELKVERIQPFENCIRGLIAVAERRQKLPPTTFEFSVTQLRERSKAAYLAALTELIREIVNDQLRRQLKSFRISLQEIVKMGAQFALNFDRIREQIEAQQTAGLNASIRSPSSIVVQLEGPSKDEVLAGMYEFHNCGGPVELAQFLMNRWEAKLRERAEVELPALAEMGTITSFLLRLTTETTSDAFIELFHASLGVGHSIYEIIESAGIALVARELCRRSAPFVDLSNRDLPEFNITPYVHGIVRLPKPTRPRDGQISALLILEIRKHGAFSVREVPDSLHNAISVVQILAGFPIAVMSSANSLLQHYKACDAIGHPVHLVGFLSESPTGLPIKKYVKLAELIDFQSDKNSLERDNGRTQT